MNCSMKSKVVVVLLFVCLGVSVTNAQNINTQDIVSLLEKKDWSDVNAFLIKKGFEYHTSERKNFHEQTITWSFEKSWDDAASAWFYLSVYDDEPILISYNFFNEKSYKSITQTLAKSSFLKYDQKVEDKEMTIFYKNASYYLSIAQEQRDRMYGDGTMTGYHVYLYKRGGRLDDDNGKKEEEDEDGNIITYTLKDGKINGLVEVKDEDGNLIKRFTVINGNREGEFYEVLDDTSYIVGRYLNNEENGKVKRYYLSNKKIISEHTFKNGTLHGERIFYYPSGKIQKKENYIEGNLSGNVTLWNEDGSLGAENHYLNGKLTGLQKEYYYPTDSTRVIHEFGMKEDVEEGENKWVYVKNGKSQTIERGNYKMGKLDGSYFHCTSDSIVFCHYKGGVLHGEYSCTKDLAAMIFGGIPNCDTNGGTLFVSHGYYCFGERCGKWEFGGTTLEVGEYNKGEKDGVWKTYVGINYDDYGEEQGIKVLSREDVNNIDSLQLLSITTYQDGEKNGMETIYMLYDSISHSYINRKIILNYRSNKLDGQALFYDEDGNIKNEGRYSNDKKYGEWIWYGNNGVTVVEKYFSPGLLSGRTIKNYDNPIIDWGFNTAGNIASVTVHTPYIIKFSEINKTTCSVSLQKEDSVINITKVSHDGISFDSIQQIKEIVSRIDENDFSVRYGKYEVKDASGRMLETGSINGKLRIGQWTYFYYNQNIKIYITYQAGNPQSEEYKTLDGIPFSGKFEYVDAVNNVKEVRNIKDGLRHGKTIYYNMTTGKVLRKVSYKKGIEKD